MGPPPDTDPGTTAVPVPNVPVPVPPVDPDAPFEVPIVEEEDEPAEPPQGAGTEDPDDVSVTVVDTDPEPEDVNFEVVENCNNILAALKTNFPEFAQIISDVIPLVCFFLFCCCEPLACTLVVISQVYHPGVIGLCPTLQVTPEWINELFLREDVTLTVLVPPRSSANGVLYSFEQGDMSAEQVRDLVLTHVIQRDLRFDDLVDLPQDEAVPTLLEGTSLQPSLAGVTSGTSAGEEGSGSIGLIDADLDACIENGVMHTIKGWLVPADVTLPDSAAPRDVDLENEGGGGLSTIARYSIIGAGGVLTLTVLGICVYCLLFSGAERSGLQPISISMDQHFPNSNTGAATGGAAVPYWAHNHDHGVYDDYGKPVDPYNSGAYQSGAPYQAQNNVYFPDTQGHHLGVSSTGASTYQHRRMNGTGLMKATNGNRAEPFSDVSGRPMVPYTVGASFRFLKRSLRSRACFTSILARCRTQSHVLIACKKTWVTQAAVRVVYMQDPLARQHFPACPQQRFSHQIPVHSPRRSGHGYRLSWTCSETLLSWINSSCWVQRNDDGEV